MSVGLLILAVFAPLPYWLIGLPWVLGGRRVPLAPLLGCAITGLWAELALMAGLPMKGSTAALIAMSAAAVAIRWRDLAAARASFLEWLPWYCVSVLAASVSPFPVLGSWSGDWLTIYEMGQAVASGDLPRSMLARPPLFGAATLPLWLFRDGLAPYQLMAAVASAASLGATADFLRFVQPRARNLWLLPLVLSPFFLHDTAAAWSKLLAGAFVLTAACEAFRSARWASAIFFAMAVATHEGFIIWAPCILLCHVDTRLRWQALGKAAIAMAVAGAAIVAPLLLWIAVKYGLNAKISANPSITDLAPIPLYEKTILGVLASFVAWGPTEVVARWMSHAHPLDRAIVAKEGYWLVTSWFTGLAASLFGLLWPFLLIWRRFRSVAWFEHVAWSRLWVSIGIPIAVVLNSALAGFYSSHGMLQAALSPLAMGSFAFLAAHAFANDTREHRALRIVSWATAIVGTLPWALVNGAMTTGLVLSEAMRERMRNASEGDYFRILDNKLEPLGLIGFPSIQLLAAGALCLGWVLWMRDTNRGSATSEAQDARLGVQTRP
jgi:hypothetical protein